jgi:hypothetical protein
MRTCELHFSPLTCFFAHPEAPAYASLHANMLYCGGQKLPRTAQQPLILRSTGGDAARGADYCLTSAAPAPPMCLTAPVCYTDVPHEAALPLYSAGRWITIHWGLAPSLTWHQIDDRPKRNLALFVLLSARACVLSSITALTLQASTPHRPVACPDIALFWTPMMQLFTSATPSLCTSPGHSALEQTLTCHLHKSRPQAACSVFCYPYSLR